MVPGGKRESVQPRSAAQINWEAQFGLAWDQRMTICSQWNVLRTLVITTFETWGVAPKMFAGLLPSDFLHSTRVARARNRSRMWVRCRFATRRNPSLRCLGFESRYPKGTRERCQPPHGGDPILRAGEAELPERPRYFPNYTRSGGSRQETVSRLRWESAADPLLSD